MQDKHIGSCIRNWQKEVVRISLYQLCGKWESFVKAERECVLKRGLRMPD